MRMLIVCLGVYAFLTCLGADADEVAGGRRVDVHLYGSGDAATDAKLAPWYREIGVTDLWVYMLEGAFPQDQRAEAQLSIEELQGFGFLETYSKNGLRYWWFERPVPDFAYVTYERPDGSKADLWDSSAETEAFWNGVCERVREVYPEVGKAGFRGLVFDNEAYYSYKGDESGKEKPWVWGGHEDQYGLGGNYHKRGLQVGRAIKAVWPDAKVIMVYAFGYPGERWWYQGFKDAGLEVFLGAEHTYGAGPAKEGTAWYQSWWQGKRTKEMCDLKRKQFPFVRDNQHVMAGVFPVDFKNSRPNYLAKYFREQVDSAANGDPAGAIPIWIWPEGPFTPESWKSIACQEGETPDDYLKVLREFSAAFARRPIPEAGGKKTGE